MAFYRGEEGSVKFKNTAGTVAAVTATRSWTLSVTKDVLDCTAQGATSRSYVGGFIDGSGSVEFLNDVFTTEDDGTAKFELFLDTSTSKKLTFDGIITGAEFGTSVGDLVAVTVNFQTNGAITSAA